MMLAIIGVVMALLVGVVCRVLDLPLPAPPRLQGAFLVVAMTLGFIAAARVLE